MESAPESIAVHALMALGNDENARFEAPPFFFNSLTSQRVKHVKSSTASLLKKPALKRQHCQQPTRSAWACTKQSIPPPQFLSAAALDQTRQELLLELNRQALLPMTMEPPPMATSDPWSSERVLTQHMEWQQRLRVALSGCSEHTQKAIQRVEQLDLPVREIVQDHRERSQLHLWRNPAVRKAAMQLGAKRVLQHMRQHPGAATAA